MSVASKPSISGYDTLAQRFSSYSEPLNLADIRGPEPIGPVRLRERELEHEISWIFDIGYLARATEDDAKRKVDTLYGYLYARKRYVIVPCVISNGEMACWVHCVLTSGIRGNYLSKKVNAPTYAENILSC